MKVIKFGGTSVANPDSLSLVIDIIKNSDQRQLVVVSALSGITDLLSTMAKRASNSKKHHKEFLGIIEDRHKILIDHFIPVTKQSETISFLKTQINELEEILDSLFKLNEITPKSNSKILSFGEILSSNIIYKILKNEGCNIIFKDSREIIFKKTINNREVVDDYLSEKKTITFLNKHKHEIILFPGIIASDAEGNTLTLGRGGSDLTASLLANYSDANKLEIWSDVSGMYTANPKLVSQAIPIRKLSYQEAMELSHFGAKVIYPPTLQPLIKKNIPVNIKNTFDSNARGTRIDRKGSKKSDGQIVKGVSHIENVALVSLEGSGMIGIPGFSKRLFQTLSDKQIIYRWGDIPVIGGVLNHEQERIRLFPKLEYRHISHDLIIKNNFVRNLTINSKFNPISIKESFFKQILLKIKTKISNNKSYPKYDFRNY